MTYRELLKTLSEFDDERLDMRVKAFSSGDYYPVDDVYASGWAATAFLVLGADLEEDE